MKHLITPEELKTNGFLNANIENEYIITALEEAQDIYLRETLGDNLYNKLLDHTEQTPPDIYDEIIENHVKYFLKYKIASLLCMVVNFKIRNAGVVTQYSSEINSSTMEDTKSVMSYFNQQADFYNNRLTKFLIKNASRIPEFKFCQNQITEPNVTHPVCSIYLG